MGLATAFDRNISGSQAVSALRFRVGRSRSKRFRRKRKRFFFRRRSNGLRAAQTIFFFWIVGQQLENSGIVMDNRGISIWIYPLVMSNSLPWKPWPIEIDGLPFLKMVDLSMAMLNNQMVNYTKHT